MNPRPVAKRPASRTSNAWSGLPLVGAGACSSVWDSLDLRPDAGKCSKVGALLHAGHIVEGILTSEGGRVLGHLMFHIVAVHPCDAMGGSLEVAYYGASSRLQTWAAQAFTASPRQRHPLYIFVEAEARASFKRELVLSCTCDAGEARNRRSRGGWNWLGREDAKSRRSSNGARGYGNSPEGIDGRGARWRSSGRVSSRGWIQSASALHW
eukprot:4839556-Amphidinium_carterae.2